MLSSKLWFVGLCFDVFFSLILRSYIYKLVTFLWQFRVLRLQAGHKYCLLGRLSSEVGWNHYDTIKVRILSVLKLVSYVLMNFIVNVFTSSCYCLLGWVMCANHACWASFVNLFYCFVIGFIFASSWWSSISSIFLSYKFELNYELKHIWPGYVVGLSKYLSGETIRSW